MTKKTRRVIGFRWRIALLVSAATLFAVSTGEADVPVSARNILQQTSTQGGVIVHLGCGDGELTAALAEKRTFLVHGLDRDATNVVASRQRLCAQGLYGRASVEQFSGSTLPYAENLVRLFVIEDFGDVTLAEIQRVLSPNGTAYVKDEGRRTKFEELRELGLQTERVADGALICRKPWPEEIDEWTHYLHDATGNAVAKDSVVGPPRRFEWIAGPRWARSHDHLASLSAMVSARGRVFYIVDEGPIASVAIQPKWFLVARDAFSGVLLWKRPVGPWEGHLRGFRSGPTELARRLVAVDDRVYVTLGYGQPICALDATTGQTIQTYDRTDGALELICCDGTLFAVVGERLPDNTDGAAKPVRPTNIWHWWPIYEETPPRKHLVAVRADTGAVLWTKSDADTAQLMPSTLAAADERVFYHSHKDVVALDASTGNVLWQTARAVSRRRPSWSTPTLVVYGDVVLSGDRAAESPPHPGAPETPEDSQWVVDSHGGIAPKGQLIALAADSGRQLWTSDCRECYNAPVDALVVDDLVWSGNLVGRGEPGMTAARDVQTGEVLRERPADQEFFKIVMGHHRCYRNKATENYVVLGRDGIELIDVETGQGYGNAWVRGTCQYGVMPCNGLIYAPPHSCACHIESKLNSFNVLAPADQVEESQSHRVEESVDLARLERGPAYDERWAESPESGAGSRRAEVSDDDAPSSGTFAPSVSGLSTLDSGLSPDWPTYRHDPLRSGRSSCAVPAGLQQAWAAELPGDRITSPVIADGRVFVACTDTHTVCALNADDGELLWSFTAGGRVDSPPTIYQGAAIFGCRDGWIYSVSAGSGELAWRFRAAPGQRRIVSYGQLESAWPVHGSVLIQDGVVFAAAGRSSFLDGGMVLVRLNARTGERLSETPITAPALPDILSSDGASVFMRHQRYDTLGVAQPGAVRHLYSPAGFLDDSWWHRTYWIIGTGMRSGWGSWPASGSQVPAGRLLVLDDSTVYGFGRFNQYHRNGSHVGLGKTRYYLYASTIAEAAVPAGKAKRRSGAASPGGVPSRWSVPLPLLARGMVLCGDTLFVAGPPDVFAYAPDDTTDPYHVASAEALREQDASLAGERGGRLMALSGEDGRTLAEYNLDAPPSWDSMAAADERLYLSAGDGTVLCFEGK